MTPAVRLLIASLGFLLAGATSAAAEVIHGSRIIWYCENQGCGCGTCGGGVSFDFNTQNLVDHWSDDADLGVGFGCDGGPYFDPSVTSLNGATGTAYPDSTLEELTMAPPPPYGSFWMWDDLNTTYVMLTGDGLYVKFASRAFHEIHCIYAGVEVEYYVQTDGTPFFTPTLPVQSTTWGQIKALYR